MTPAQATRLQDLPPSWARFCLSVRTFAARSLGCDFPALPCVAAVSGGADSTALLRLAALLAPLHGGSLRAVHLDHGLRPDSTDDAGFVAGLCAGLGVALTSERIDVAALASREGLGLEEAGRRARYGLLERVREETGAAVVLVAHQLDDLAEDQLMRMGRGAGWPALGGMEARDERRALLRPLLLTPRSEIEGFLRALGQSWRDDPTNFEPGGTRNRVRQVLLPALIRENPNYLASAARLWRQARVDEAHWSAELGRSLSPEPLEDGTLLLCAGALTAATEALRLRAYKAALDALGQGQALGEGLFQLDGLWQSRATGKAVRFPGDKEARITRQGVRFRVIDRKKECG